MMSRTLGGSESFWIALVALVASLLWGLTEDGGPSLPVAAALGLSLFALACIVTAHLLRRRAERFLRSSDSEPDGPGHAHGPRDALNQRGRRLG